ncbi:hypothetical protein Blue_104 [Bacillus phage Deep Blue]|uniref:Uncharacterized protein n=1 Tax=Bacillus phage Deep Blue TaxID=1792245 RepID=A0A140HLR5_9CAUD|nr:hypothetical protein Blue_104 [Bacillus phage Deep Blue]AMO25927.1 hypothetical protein Blue_104 [Bacillus phage Deep Blue]
MTVKKLSLVKYAGEWFFTLADYTLTRSTEGYSDSASVKSAVRTFVVKSDATKYISFRGEAQLKNIIQENKDNPMFNPEDFQGTRIGIIAWDMLEPLNNRFKDNKEYRKVLKDFTEQGNAYIDSQTQNTSTEPHEANDPTESRAIVLRTLRSDLNRLDKEIETRQVNREKILQAINALESLEIETV